ncbi:hypothetical protein CEP11_17085 [Cylindrospermopsis raciborskii S10]|nr:hypothetical protein CEP11_17085 [Cylindrospermopsis raciborskii S10]PNK18199.1 hypothetical protein CEP08_09455 [Cylindrospermopsis raciborskii S05]
MALPKGDRSHLGTFHVRFAVGKRLTVNVFRQRMNQLFQGVEDIWRAIALHSRRDLTLHPPWAIALSDYPPVSSQGKNLNVLRGDCITPPTSDRIQCSPGSFSRENLNMGTGDRIALPTGDRSHLGTFHVRFAVGKRLTVNVFRQRINQLFQGVEDIWRGIAKHSQWGIALHSRRAIVFRNSHPIPSQGKI